MSSMQFGIFSVGDLTVDPTNGSTPTEHERLKSLVAIAKKSEDIGLDVFAVGEHHDYGFVPPSISTGTLPVGDRSASVSRQPSPESCSTSSSNGMSKCFSTSQGRSDQVE